MVQGPCRGNMCDFWARVKLRKRTTNEITQEMYLNIRECDNPGHTKLDDAIIEYWTAFGVKNIERLCEEDPDLCIKMKDINAQVQLLFS
ncbi:MAG: hypothetical protein ACW98J_02085 [Candidatus Thorarchaeota archaeon]|jgi:hypothetical protein